VVTEGLRAARIPALPGAAQRTEHEVAERLRRDLKRVGGEDGQGELAWVSKISAQTHVAGAFARQWGVLPKEWGARGASIRAVHGMVDGVNATRPSAPPSTLDTVRDYTKEHKQDLIELASANAKNEYNMAKFGAAEGFLRRRDGVIEVLVPSYVVSGARARTTSW
jgi:hypothetical protein